MFLADLLHMVEALLEATVRPAKRHFQVNIEPAGDIGQGEKKVPEFPRPLLLGRGLL